MIESSTEGSWVKSFIYDILQIHSEKDRYVKKKQISNLFYDIWVRKINILFFRYRQAHDFKRISMLLTLNTNFK